MVKLMRTMLIGFSLLAFLALMSHQAMAQDIDAKIKKLEEMEVRIDAKLRKLEEMEARLEARLEPVAARSEGVVAPGGDGKRGMALGVPSTSVLGAAGASVRHEKGLGEESIHQVIFRGGFTNLNRAAQSAVFTGSKNDTAGWNVGAVIGVHLFRDPFFENPINGEVSLDFSRITGNTKFALGKSGNQSLFRVSVAPKYRIDNFGRIRPWITPIGLSFLVNSPPSDSAAYLTVGGTTGAGIEYLVHERLSMGLGLSYNFYDKTSNRINANHLSVGPYVGINY